MTRVEYEHNRLVCIDYRVATNHRYVCQQVSAISTISNRLLQATNTNHQALGPYNYGIIAIPSKQGWAMILGICKSIALTGRHNALLWT